MRKPIIIILAVAIIGALGIYGKSGGRTGSASASTGSSQNTAVAKPQDNSAALGASASGSVSPSAAGFKDGTFTGNSEETAYGTVQIAVVVSGGRITDINFLKMPNDRGHTQEVTAVAGPLLKQETLQKQSYHIDFVSGATSTSEGYQQSLQAALNRAT